MKEFYHSVVETILRIDNWREWDAWWTVKQTDMERLALMECREAEDAVRIHSHKMHLMRKDLAQRERAAAKFGDGEPDTLLEFFFAFLQEEQENEWVNAVFPLMRQGLSAGEIAEQLQISEETVTEAENALCELYQKASRRMGEHIETKREQESCAAARARMQFLGLVTNAFRVFRKENGDSAQYRFYYRDRLLGTASGGTGPDRMLVIRCEGLMLNSGFDPNMPVVPGCSRSIVDADNPAAEVARLTYLGENEYELCLNWDTGPVTLHIRGERREIYEGDSKIAAISQPEDVHQMFDWTLQHYMFTKKSSGFEEETLDDWTAMLLMSFPLLRFDK